MKRSTVLQLKSIAVCFFVLLYLPQAIAQIDLIPFRSGKFWGVSDSMGKLVILTRYDEVLLHGELVNRKPVQLPPGYFICRKDSLFGLLHNDEVLPVQYLSLEAMYYRFLVGTQIIDKQAVRFMFNFNGLSLLPEGYFFERLIWIKPEPEPWQLTSGLAAFLCVDKQGRKSIIVTDFAGVRKPQFLVKDAFALRVRLPEDDRSWMYEVKQEATDVFTRYEAYYDVERKMVLVEKTATASLPKYGDMGSPNGVESESRIAIKEGAPDEKLRSNKAVSHDALIYFSKKQNKVFAQYFWQNAADANSTDRSKTLPIEIPAEAKNVQVINYYQQNGWPEKLKDTQYQFKHFIQYQYQGKTALMYHHLLPVLWLDSLRYVATQAYGQKKWPGEFLFGNKQDNGSMKFGFMQANGTVVIPAMYDDIVIADPNDRYAKYASGAYWVVSQQGKAGIVWPDNQVQLPLIYDRIQFMKGNSQKKPFFLLKQGNLYGVAFANPFANQQSLPVLQLIQPFGEHQIVDLHQIGDRKKPNSPVILLLLLQNEKGEKIGWRNVTGRNYFRY